jgi:hypothetical protein
MKSKEEILRLFHLNANLIGTADSLFDKVKYFQSYISESKPLDNPVVTKLIAQYAGIAHAVDWLTIQIANGGNAQRATTDERQQAALYGAGEFCCRIRDHVVGRATFAGWMAEAGSGRDVAVPPAQTARRAAQVKALMRKHRGAPDGQIGGATHQPEPPVGVRRHG